MSYQDQPRSEFQSQLTAAAQQQVAQENPFHDQSIGSKNYWAAHTGREDPPAPSYRMVKGKLKLGRYIDPYGCEAHMRSAKNLWAEWYTGFLISGGIGALFGTVDWVFIFLVLPVFAVWYFVVRARFRHQYDQYYRIQERCLATGMPEWVAYDKDRLKLLDRNPLAVWP
jgi:hypothetical protein